MRVFNSVYYYHVYRGTVKSFLMLAILTDNTISSQTQSNGVEGLRGDGEKEPKWGLDMGLPY